MNKRITAVIFSAVFTISLSLISQAGEQPAADNEACLSGSALEISFDCFEEISENEEQTEISTNEYNEVSGCFEEFDAADGFGEMFSADCTEICPEEDSRPAVPADTSSDIHVPGKNPDKPNRPDKPGKPMPYEEKEPEKTNTDSENGHYFDYEPAAGFETAPNDSFEENKKDNENLYSDDDTGCTDFEIDEPSLPGEHFDDDIIKSPLPEEPEQFQDKSSYLTVPEKSHSGSGRSSSGRKYSAGSSSDVSGDTNAETAEAENIVSTSENSKNNSPISNPDGKIYSGEELKKQADTQNGTVTFNKNGTMLEIPADFIENNNIENDDIISVLINRNDNAVDVSVSINGEDVNEIEGAKIIVPDNNGKINIIPADSMGEYYISGSYNKALWPLGSAFPIVIALAYILLMGGAAAAVWKKIRSM